MSGRISDFAVYEANPAIFYVGTAHGGVWKTTSNGAQFTPLLQDRGLLSIGAVAVQQSNPNVVWVGTGESNNRQSTSWGEGLYKSTDGGKTFTHVGLRESKHINRIVIDPRNPDVVFVAATGPLFGPGGERGLYKTTDGGKTLARRASRATTDTGANDVRISYSDPDVMYASMYQRRRTACCMNGGGPGSAIYKSTDGGEHVDEARRRPAAVAARPHLARRLPRQLEHRVRRHRRAGGGGPAAARWREAAVAAAVAAADAAARSTPEPPACIAPTTAAPRGAR